MAKKIKKVRLAITSVADFESAIQEWLRDCTSHRSFAIGGAALVSDCLELYLKSQMLEDADVMVGLFGIDRPLVSFGAKSLLARALSLVNADEFKDLEIIRDIRNTFAHYFKVDDPEHGIVVATFDAAPITKRCRQLWTPDNLPSALLGDREYVKPVTAFDRFRATVTLLAGRFAGRAHSAGKYLPPYGPPSLTT